MVRIKGIYRKLVGRHERKKFFYDRTFSLKVFSYLKNCVFSMTFPTCIVTISYRPRRSLRSSSFFPVHGRCLWNYHHTVSQNPKYIQMFNCNFSAKFFVLLRCYQFGKWKISREVREEKRRYRDSLSYCLIWQLI